MVLAEAKIALLKEKKQNKNGKQKYPSVWTISKFSQRNHRNKGNIDTPNMTTHLM